ncbi:MAG TPA: sugar phosphate isomerase/epimerase, partial [Bacillales bacterium]|nr:sugar phosphate isomerase/epimerase [Bacillales bacterium]
EMLKTAAETMNEAAKSCAELGVKACLHPHIGTEIQYEHELDAIMEWTDPKFVHFCPDTAHLAKAGMDPAKVMKKYRDRIGYVHLKDISPEEADAKQFPILSGNEAMPIFCELGLGTLNFDPVMELLRETNYNGWVTVEIDQSTSTPKQSLQVCKDFAEERLKLPVGKV